MSYEIQEFRNVAGHADLGGLVPGLEECISSAFGGTITQDDARHHMEGQQVLVATTERGIVHGFSSTSVISPREQFGDPVFSEEPGLYFVGAAIHQDAQGNGLYHQLNQRRLAFGAEAGVSFVFTRTQNPRVQEGIAKLMDRLVATGEVAGPIELGRFVCRGAYGHMLTSEKPVARELVFDDIDYDQGDAAIITWRFAAPLGNGQR